MCVFSVKKSFYCLCWVVERKTIEEHDELLLTL